MSYKVEVLAVGEKEFCSNAIRYPTKEMAEQEGKNLALRWHMVRDCKVVESNEPVFYYDEAGNKIEGG